jgi:hypothetical protein
MIDIQGSIKQEKRRAKSMLFTKGLALNLLKQKEGR